MSMCFSFDFIVSNQSNNMDDNWNESIKWTNKQMGLTLRRENENDQSINTWIHFAHKSISICNLFCDFRCDQDIDYFSR